MVNKSLPQLITKKLMKHAKNYKLLLMYVLNLKMLTLNIKLKLEDNGN